MALRLHAPSPFNTADADALDEVALGDRGEKLTQEEDVDRRCQEVGHDNRQEAVDPAQLVEDEEGRDQLDDARQHHRRQEHDEKDVTCLLYTSPSPRDGLLSRM